MKYLLDVCSLVALGLVRHEFHDRVALWTRSRRSSSLLTCSITEIGFVRIAVQATAYGLSVAQARALLLELKAAKALSVDFISDSNDASFLPAWVKSSKQTTDGHLLQLAATNGAVLATLDHNIPGAYVIPK